MRKFTYDVGHQFFGMAYTIEKVASPKGGHQDLVKTSKVHYWKYAFSLLDYRAAGLVAGHQGRIHQDMEPPRSRQPYRRFDHVGRWDS